jgi:hypothetical protein
MAVNGTTSDAAVKNRISRRQLLKYGAIGGVLGALPVVRALLRWWESRERAAFLVGPIQVDRNSNRTQVKQKSYPVDIVEDAVVQPRFCVVANKLHWEAQDVLRVTVGMSFRGDPLELPKQRRVALRMALLDSGRRELIAATEQYLDGRAMDAKMDEAFPPMFGPRSDEVTACFNFRPEFARDLRYIELSFVEKEPLVVAAKPADMPVDAVAAAKLSSPYSPSSSGAVAYRPASGAATRR